MKFLCPSCKAKYQIADEKVAGRSVRMKCRKCGHMISIAKAVTEGSASRRLEGLGSKPPPSSSAAQSPSAPASAEKPRPQKPPVPTRSAAAPPRAAAASPAARPSGPVRPAAPARPARPAPPKPAPRAVPRASSPLAAPAPWAAKATAAKTESPSAPAETPQPARSAVRASPEPHTVTPSPAKADNGSVASGSFGALGAEAGSSRYDEDEDEQTVIAGVGALAGAFSQAVKAPDSSTLITTPSDEWYVGINGVPVGPIRLSELRSKAASGAISQESLVWREGFEQWQALGTFPELIAIVEEGLSSARASLTPLSPPASHVPQTAAFAPTPAVPVGVLSDPFALPAEPPPPSVERAPFPELAVVPPRRSTGAAAWIAVVVALLFGLTIGFVLFSRDKAEPVVKIVEVPAKTEDPKGDEPTKPASTETETVEVGANPKIARGGGPLPKSGQTDKQPEKTGGLSGLKGLSAGTDGPSAGSGGGNELAGGPTNQLDSGQVQKVVSRYTSSVKRSCWQPALDTRTQDAPTSARVSVTITVGPSGSVSNVTTSGDPKGYRGLASCIASRVRGWQFPASSGTTTVNVPFFFAAQ